MSRALVRRRLFWRIRLFQGLLASLLASASASAGPPDANPSNTEPAPAPGPALFAVPAQGSVPFTAPPTDPGLRPLPIDLPTALRLANARAIDIAAATARLRIAFASLDQAKALWLPTVTFGADYFRHDGRVQNSAGVVSDSDYSSTLLGVGSGPGATAIISFNDAFFAPLAARQVLRARQADLQAAANDSMLATTDAYFTTQQARGELAGALDATRRAVELVRRTDQLAAGLVPPVEAVRARAELARRRQAELLARERWRVSAAELLRVLRLNPGTLVDPVEPPQLRVDLVRLDMSVDELIPVGLTLRPELASQQALVQASLQLLRQERLRPLVPSLLLRGASTNPTGTFGAGVFGGGMDSSLNNYSARLDVDVQLLWQLDNLGFGNRARIRSREAEREQAMIALFRVQDIVAAEISQAYAQAQLSAERVVLAEQGVRLAVESAEKNLAGVGQTRRAGDLVVLVIRPQEAVASVQALAQAYIDYYGAVADANRAQFRLYRALGNPAQLLIGCPAPTPCAASPPLAPTIAPAVSGTP
jgi:outer membrane protein TolC